MAINFPGPYEVRINYNCNIGGLILNHTQRLNVRISGTPDVGTPFGSINCLRRDDQAFNLASEVDAWVALLRPLYLAGGTNFTTAELWKYTAQSFESSFVSSYSIGLAGTGGANNVGAGQVIWSFRTEEGGIMKIALMESAIQAGSSAGYANMSADQKAIADAVQLGTSPWLARDTSYPFTVIAMHPGQSEAVFKKRYRQL